MNLENREHQSGRYEALVFTKEMNEIVMSFFHSGDAWLEGLR